MAVTKFLARDLSIGISASGSGGDFIDIKGLNSLTHSPSSTDAETTDFDSDGYAEHMKAERNDSWTLAGYYLEDVLTGARDPGQAAVEALAQLRGPASLGLFQIVSPGGNTITFEGTCETTWHGGGNNDAAAWQAVLRMSGPPSYS